MQLFIKKKCNSTCVITFMTQSIPWPPSFINIYIIYLQKHYSFFIRAHKNDRIANLSIYLFQRDVNFYHGLTNPCKSIEFDLYRGLTFPLNYVRYAGALSGGIKVVVNKK